MCEGRRVHWSVPSLNPPLTVIKVTVNVTAQAFHQEQYQHKTVPKTCVRAGGSTGPSRGHTPPQRSGWPCRRRPQRRRVCSPPRLLLKSGENKIRINRKNPLYRILYIINQYKHVQLALHRYHAWRK